MIIKPHPGPQSVFSATTADVALFGGSAGPGKTRALVYEPTRHVHVPGFTGALFRRTSPELQGSGSIWEEACGIYPLLGGKMREHRLDARFPSNALIEFEACQYEKDLNQFQSKQYCFIGFDELTHFTARMFWYLFSRNRSTCGVKPYIRAATNPDADSFVRELIDWWIGKDGLPIPERSGVIRWMARVEEEIIWRATREEMPKTHKGRKVRPKSFTFVAAKLSDNPTMAEKDPGYEASLDMLPMVDRLRLRDGNWNIKPSAGDFFQRHWFEIVDAAPSQVVSRVRCWDKAGSTKLNKNQDGEDINRAWTVGVLMSMVANGTFYIEDVVRLQGRPAEVEDAIKNTATRDGRMVDVMIWQDPGQAGVTDIDHYMRILAGWNVIGIPASEDKVSYAKPVSAQAERGNVKIVRAKWNETYLYELENFPAIRLKDCVDATSGALLCITGGGVDVVDMSDNRLMRPTDRIY